MARPRHLVIADAPRYRIPLHPTEIIHEPFRWPVTPVGPQVYRVQARPLPMAIRIEPIDAFTSLNPSQQRSYLYWRGRRREGEYIDAPQPYVSFYVRDVAAGWEVGDPMRAVEILKTIPATRWPGARRLAGRYIADIAHMTGGKEEWEKIALEEIIAGSALLPQAKSYILQSVLQDTPLASQVLTGMWRIRTRPSRLVPRDEIEPKFREILIKSIENWEDWTKRSIWQWADPGNPETTFNKCLRGAGRSYGYQMDLGQVVPYAIAPTLRGLVRSLADHVSYVVRSQSAENFWPRSIPWLPPHVMNEITEELGGWGPIGDIYKQLERPRQRRMDFVPFSSVLGSRRDGLLLLNHAEVDRLDREADETSRMLYVEDDEDGFDMDNEMELAGEIRQRPYVGDELELDFGDNFLISTQVDLHEMVPETTSPFTTQMHGLLEKLHENPSPEEDVEFFLEEMEVRYPSRLIEELNGISQECFGFQAVEKINGTYHLNPYLMENLMPPEEEPRYGKTEIASPFSPVMLALLDKLAESSMPVDEAEYFLEDAGEKYPSRVLEELNALSSKIYGTLAIERSEGMLRMNPHFSTETMKSEQIEEVDQAVNNELGMAL